MATPRGRRKDFAPMEEILKPVLPEPEQSHVRNHPYSRAIAHYVAEFILRSASSISEVFENDYEAAILFMTISNRNSEKVMADPKLRDEYGSYGSTIPPEHTLLISRMALARATGLPRETGRRKVAKLLQKGWVVELQGGLRARPDLTRDARYVAAIEPMAPNLRRLFTQLLATGAQNSCQRLFHRLEGVRDFGGCLLGAGGGGVGDRAARLGGEVFQRLLLRRVGRVGDRAGAVGRARVHLLHVVAVAARADEAVQRVVQMHVGVVRVRGGAGKLGVRLRGRDFLRGVGGEGGSGDEQDDRDGGALADVAGSHDFSPYRLRA